MLAQKSVHPNPPRTVLRRCQAERKTAPRVAQQTLAGSKQARPNRVQVNVVASAAQVSVAALADGAEFDFAAGSVLARHEAKGGGEVSAAVEMSRVGDNCGDRAAEDRAESLQDILKKVRICL